MKIRKIRFPFRIARQPIRDRIYEIMCYLTFEIDRSLEDDPQTEAELAFVDPLPRQA